MGSPSLIEDWSRGHRQTCNKVFKALHVVADYSKVLSMEVQVQAIPVKVKAFNQGQNAFSLVVDCTAARGQRSFPLP
ncbi:MAG TPA: hypothetical protein VMR62_25630 [Bryobacteraceae bacterium]|jgi:hypothetical protein|nr:hypothetical protein [Bryobacteraceae bacterium]